MFSFLDGHEEKFILYYILIVKHKKVIVEVLSTFVPIDQNHSLAMIYIIIFIHVNRYILRIEEAPNLFFFYPTATVTGIKIIIPFGIKSPRNIGAK